MVRPAETNRVLIRPVSLCHVRVQNPRFARDIEFARIRARCDKAISHFLLARPNTDSESVLFREDSPVHNKAQVPSRGRNCTCSLFISSLSRGFGGSLAVETLAAAGFRPWQHTRTLWNGNSVDLNRSSEVAERCKVCRGVRDSQVEAR